MSATTRHSPIRPFAAASAAKPMLRPSGRLRKAPERLPQALGGYVASAGLRLKPFIGGRVDAVPPSDIRRGDGEAAAPVVVEGVDGTEASIAARAMGAAGRGAASF